MMQLIDTDSLAIIPEAEVFEGLLLVDEKPASMSMPCQMEPCRTG